MKIRLFIAILTLAVAGVVSAQEPAPEQEQPVENPDFTKPKLRVILSADDTPPPRQRRIKHTPGAIEFRAWGMDWRIAYLPILMPLAGSRMGTTNEWPDAFKLTGTQFASPPRTWRQDRAVNAELRRINRLDRKRAKVVVK